MLPAPTDYPEPDERDHEIFAATVAPDHYLRRVKEVIDFSRCRETFADCYSTGLGRPAKEPILLLKLEFLQFQYNLSDREVIRRARQDMAFRYFLDLSLKSRLPHPTVLTKFRDRLGVEKHQELFDDIVAQARARGLVKDRLRLKDATHVIANVAIPTTVGLVAQVRERLLEAVRPYAPARAAAEQAEATTIRQATQDLAGVQRLLPRVKHLRTIVTWVDALVVKLGPPADGDQQRQTLAEALAMAHQVLADRENPKATDKLASVADPDARWGKHGVSYVGFLMDAAIDSYSSLITAINVLPANGDEGADATTLLQQEEQAHGNDVEALSIDGAGFRGSLLREWTDPEGLNVEVFVPPTAEASQVYFTPDQFTCNAAGDRLTCPAGETARNHTRSSSDAGWVFRFRRATCEGCPLREKCMAKMPKSGGRVVFKSDYEAEYKAARAKAKTPAYEAARRQHGRIERKLAELVRWHGARRARYRGRLKVKVQMLLTAVVVNVKRIVRLLGAGTVRASLAGTT
jgi:transposase